MKFNLGCGAQVVENWVNVDFALGARFARIPFFVPINRKLRFFDLDWAKEIYLHDLTKRFPWEESSASVVYSSHTLEHFSREDGRRFLAECYRILCKNGIIRIVVPDLRRLVEKYCEGQIRSDDFLEKLGVLYGNSPSKLRNRLAPFVQFPHKCMYDATRLLAILEEIGFRQLSTRDAFDSDILDICLVELQGRTEDAVIVEGRK